VQVTEFAFCMTVIPFLAIPAPADHRTVLSPFRNSVHLEESLFVSVVVPAPGSTDGTLVQQHAR